MRRPGRAPPQWATASAYLSEPLTGKAAVGFIPDELPPADWFNYTWNQQGQWLGYLTGPSQVVWSARTFADPSTGVARGDVDAVTVDDAECRYRYAVCGIDGTGAFVAVSRTGAAWITQRNLPGSPGTPAGILFVDYWYLWSSAGLYYTLPDSTGNDATNALRNAGVDWIAEVLPATPGTLAAGAGGDAGIVFSTSTKLLYRPFASGGGSWTAVTIGTREAGRAIAWTGTTFVELSSSAGNGVIHTATNPAGTWTNVTTLTGVGAGTAWQLATGDTGVIVAFKTGVDVPEVWTSVDHGATWSSVTTPAALKQLTALRWHDGVWVATSTVAPYAWTSGDLESWLALPIPVGESGNELRDVLYGNGAWLLVSRSGALQGAPAIDPGTEGYTPGTEASTPGNAGWLRGRKISLTAPTDGQVLAYDAGLGQYVPATPAVTAAYTVRTKTTTYTALAGDVLLCDASGGAFTVTLPSAASVTGQSISVKKTDASANAVTVAGAPFGVGFETIDGATTLPLATQYTAVTLWSDGTSWWVF